jgi:hypothetical protein
MREKIIRALFLVIGIISLVPGVAYSGQWAIVYGSGSESWTGGLDPVTSGGGYYLYGSKTTAAGGADAVFGLLNSKGAVTWAKEIGPGTDATDYLNVQVAPGGFLVDGSEAPVAPGSVGSAIWAKFDNSWNQVYAYSFGGLENEVWISVTGNFSDTTDNGLIYTGSLVTGQDTETACSDIFIFKTNSAGSIVWKNELQYKCEDQAYQALEVSDGYLIVGTLMDPSANASSLLLMKYSKTGKRSWAKAYSVANESLTGGNLRRLSDGNFLLSGGMTDPTAPLVDGKILLAKVDSAGRIQWQNSYGISGLTLTPLNAIESASDKSIIISGSTFSSLYNANTVLIKVKSANGALVKGVKIGASSENDSDTVTESSSGDLLISGSHSISPGKATIFFGKVDKTTLEPVWTKAFAGGAYGKGMLIETATGFLLSGSYGKNFSEEDIFGMLLDRSGNSNNCKISPLALQTTSPVIHAATKLTVSKPSFKTGANETIKPNPISLPVKTLSVPSAPICPHISALPTGREDAMDISCGD